MPAEVRDECGIAAVYVRPGAKLQKSWFDKLLNGDKQKYSMLMYRMLLNLQNRGHLSAGVSSYDPNRPKLLNTYRRLGTVDEAFRISNKDKRKKIFRTYNGMALIGHVRYATCGADDRNFAQPFERHHGRKWKWFSFCFNGNLANYSQLKKSLEKAGYHLIRKTDTEIIKHYLSRELKGTRKPNMVKVFGNLAKMFDGAWSLAFLNADGDMVVARDPNGFKPTCYSITKNVVVAASESNALLNCGFKNIKFLQPGEMLLVQNGKATVKRFAKVKKRSHCMFEWVYFANVASRLDDRSVYLARTELGKELARSETLKYTKDFIVVPVPDTAKPSADAYAYELGLLSQEGLMRNRYVGRTFIEGERREDKVKNKYIALKEVLEGKKILLVDDSLVRGTTLKNLIRYMREDGKVKEIHVRISCPPIMGPCFYGIDMSTLGELFAPRQGNNLKNGVIPDKILSKMAKELGADSLRYQTMDGLKRAVGLNGKLCLACLNGDYPTKAGKEMFKLAKKSSGLGRTHEICKS